MARESKAFNRGLEKSFVERLNQLYDDADSWWKAFVDDPDTFVAIRDNSVNVYFRGASLLRLEPSGHDIKATVHYKYLVRPRAKNEYVTVAKDGVIGKGDRLAVTAERLDVAAVKAAARNYTDDEKTGVHKIAVKPENAVIDLEVAISHGGVALRVDFAALVESGDSVQLRFFEAKTFSNSALRGAKPGVIGQIKAYSELIRTYEARLVERYCLICRNLRSLKGVDLKGRRGALVNAVADGKELRVDDEPRLVVFDFDDSQRTGKAWGDRLEDLKHALGRDPIARGNPADIAVHG